MHLARGEATPDPFHRVTVVLSGAALAIELRDDRPSEQIPLTVGQVDWDEPFHGVHRAVNVGALPCQEVTVFFLDLADAVPRPSEE
jgi:hypothetical protein